MTLYACDLVSAGIGGLVGAVTFSILRLIWDDRR